MNEHSHYIALGLCILLIPVAQTLIKMGAGSGNAFAEIFKHPCTVAGLGVMLVVTLLSAYSFQVVEMKTSAAWTSLNYILVILASRYVLHEFVNRTRWLGCTLIVTGIVVFQFG